MKRLTPNDTLPSNKNEDVSIFDFFTSIVRQQIINAHAIDANSIGNSKSQSVELNSIEYNTYSSNINKKTTMKYVPTHKKSELIAMFDELMSQQKTDESFAFLVSKQIHNDCLFYKMTEYKGIKIKLFGNG